MRIGMIFNRDVPNVAYRAVGPGDALKALGHEVELCVQDERGRFDARPLRQCDVVHVYRRADAGVLKCVDELRRHGIAITWDNDDDIRLTPEGGRQGASITSLTASRDFQAQRKLIARADIVTTTGPYLAERYREAGAAQVVELENHLLPHHFTSEAPAHDGFVIGWVAGFEHEADATALRIADALARVLERHENVRVVTVGLRLDLPRDRYEHHAPRHFLELPAVMSQFDVGIAPLADIPMSYARSDIKLKEYAGAGVPWLASDRGPYTGLGPKQGGWLVPDDGWDEALERMVTSRLKRRALRRRAQGWAKTQTVERHADRWQAMFEQAIEAARDRPAERRRDGAAPVA